MIRKFFEGVKNTLSFIQNHFKALLFLLILFLLFAPSDTQVAKPANLVKIDLQGMILDHTEVVAKLEEAGEDANIKGVLLNINSPGGMVPPSIEIAEAVKRMEKPVIAYASGTMASGSYYASIYADQIIANPGSIVGSIGVVFEGMNFGKMLDTVGVSPQTVKVGTYKEAGTPLRKWTDAERKELQTIADDVYDIFVKDVAKARGLDPKAHENYADAHIFNAYRAKEHGLIDEVGTMYEAKKQLEVMSGVGDPVWKKKDKMERFLEKFQATLIYQLASRFEGLKAGL